MNATDLLHRVLDFICFWQNNTNKFKPEVLHGQEPSYYRLIQLESLFRAFELTSDRPIRGGLRRFTIANGQMNPATGLAEKSNLEHFISGDFIDCVQDTSVYADQIKIITSKVIELLPKYPFEKRDYHTYATISILFSKLFRFRKEIHPFTQKDNTLQLDFAFGNMYARYLTEQLSIEIADKIKDIDHALSLIIDPLQREISMDVLVEKYNYPIIDLTELDKEFRVNNF